MTDGTLRQALAFATSGWPVLPCLPGQKVPATAHGYRDATTDQQERRTAKPTEASEHSPTSSRQRD